MAVAAAGAAAGSAAGSAAMGSTAYPSGGGTPGLTSTNTGKSGISPTVQVDPTQALNYFQSAGNSYQTYATSGLSYYENTIQKAYGELQAAYNQANTTLKPLSEAGTAATNQYMRMLGLNAMSPTGDISSQVQSLGSNYADVAQQIAAAENITDPTQRDAAKQSILTAWNAANTVQQQQQQDNINKQLAALNPGGIAAQAQQQAGAFYDMDPNSPERAQIVRDAVAYQNSLPVSQKAKGYNPNDPLNIQAYYNSKLTADYNTQVSNINAQGNSASNPLSTSQNLLNQYTSDYTSTNNYSGYTGDEVTAQLRSTPGYQFQLSQGLDAINAAAAAGGMLSSGNTLLAANNYAQNYADSSYNTYMNSLSNLMGQGNAATQQIASNQTGLGTAQATLTQNQANAGLNTYTNIGSNWANQYANSANTLTQIQLANMQAQNTAIQNANQLSAQTGMQAANLSLQGAQFQNTLGQQAGFAQSVNPGSANSRWVLG